jgi:uncharacterized repeat protein (TIGR01451 family)
MRTLVVAGSLIVVCASGLSVLSTPDAGEVTGPSLPSERRLTRNPAESAALSRLPLAEQARISSVLGRDDSGYHAFTHPRGFRAQNPEHQLAADFTEAGIEVRAGTATWRFALRGYGYGDDLLAAAAIAPRASANRVEYHRGSLTEWYVNGPMGLEQGFTLADPPARTRDEPLTLAFAVAGTLTASSDLTGSGALLKRSDGTVALRYRGLTAHDALGRELQASMRIERDGFLLQVEDGDARYPVIIDPFIQQAKLTASDSEAIDEFGTSVAFSGETIVVGSLRGNGVVANTGAAYVFEKPAVGWTGNLVETAKLIASDVTATNAQFGSSVAIDGDTIAVGTHAAFAAYVFQKPAEGWAGVLTESAKLTAPGGPNRTVAISGDTVVASSPFTVPGAFVFVRPAAGWAGTLTASATLIPSDGGVGETFGRAIAMRGDLIVAGAPQDEFAGGIDQGSVYLFIKPAAGWSGTLTENAKLVASDTADFDLLGWSVALNDDTIVAGAPRVGDLDNGAVYVFEKPAAGWSGTLTERAKLVASDGGGNLGVSAAISGNTVAAGAFIDNAIAGKTYIFMRPAGGWSGTRTENQFIPAPVPSSGSVGGPRFGAAAAASGGTLVISASRERVGINNSQGAVYIFKGAEADLSLSKTATSEPVLAGNDLTYTITVMNNGPDDATSATVTDHLPAELTFVSCTATGGGACEGSGNNRIVTFASLPAGTSETIVITADVSDSTPDGTSVSNSALVTSVTGDPNSANDFDTVSVSVIHQADLAVSKAALPDPVGAGANLTYTVGVTNNGPNAASSVTVTDTLPVALTFVSCSATGGGVCGGTDNNRTVTFASLAAGLSATITIEATVGPATLDGATLSNTASATSATVDPNAANNSATVTTAVVNLADLAVTKAASASAVQVGTNVTYLVTVANSGPSSALNATLTDALPPGLTFVSNSGASGWTCVNPTAGSGGSITCSTSSLASGGTATFSIVANVSCGVADGTIMANPANLSSSTPDPNSSNNASTANVTASNPAPVVTAAVATSLLSPTNAPALVNVGLSATTSDGACAASPVSSVEVFGDEDDETPIARNEAYSPDAANIGVGTLRLRAERVKNLDGRVYLIVVKAVDAAGGVAFATATVVVPQKPGPPSIASVNAQAAAARSYADDHGGSPPPEFFVIGDGPVIGPQQ